MSTQHRFAGLIALAMFAQVARADTAPTDDCPTVLTAHLDGDQVTGGSASNATGTGTVVITKVPPDLPPIVIIVRVHVEVTGLSGAAVAAHLHFAPPGQSGTIALTLVESANGFDGTVSIGKAAFDQMVMGGSYLDVHSAAFPDGEIRGQLTTADTQFTGYAAASHVVPPVTATGKADAEVRIQADGTLAYHVKYTGLSGPATGAELRSGLYGVNGPLLANLQQTQAGSSGSFDGITASLSAVQLARIRAAGSYLLITTAMHPTGEIRAQIIGSFLPYGDGCGGSLPPSLAGDGLPRPGGDVSLVIAGGPPGANGVLLLGAKGEVLPVPGCALFVNTPFVVLGAPLLDASGSLTIDAQVPLSFAVPQWLYLQYFAAHAGAPGGVMGSNGLGMHVTN